MLLIEILPEPECLVIVLIQLKPPIWVQLLVGSRVICQCTVFLESESPLTHRLVIRPSEWTVRTGHRFGNVELWVWVW